MFCSQCGKKVMDTMLFCPFCGSPIVIPDQEDDIRAPETPEENAPAESEMEDAAVSESVENPIESFEDMDETGEFVPLNVDSVEVTVRTDAILGSSEQEDELLSREFYQEPVRLHGLKPDLSPSRQFGAPQIASPRKSADTFVPQRKFDPDDIFMDADDDEDEYDYEDYGEDEAYEDRYESGFWARHIRGFVALILLLVVAAVVIGWSFSHSGQHVLARADLAWRPSVYAEIAYEAYQKGYYSQAGSYYAKAVEHDGDNYDYITSAGVAYYMAQDMVNAEIMARLAIETDPSRINAYDILLRIYPEVSVRPIEIQNLMQTGYHLTGDSRLISAQ